MAFHRVVASAAAVGSTMEILMRGVCIICAYTGVNYTLPTSSRVCYSRGCYDIQYSFDLRGGVGLPTRCDIHYNSTYNIMLPLAADSAQGTKDCARLSRYRPRRCSLSHPDILFYTVFFLSVVI